LRDALHPDVQKRVFAWAVELAFLLRATELVAHYSSALAVITGLGMSFCMLYWMRHP
jgi:hypothetical protein